MRAFVRHGEGYRETYRELSREVDWLTAALASAEGVTGSAQF
jgi:hypothetical protein